MVLATFGGEGLTSVTDVDVTALITLNIDDSSIAALDKVGGNRGGVTYRLRGLTVGSTTLTVTSVPMLLVQSSVSVSDIAVQLSELQVLVVTGVAWETAAPATVALTPASASFSAVVQLEQKLEVEGDEAQVYAYAVFTDGTMQRVPANEVELAPKLGAVGAERARREAALAQQREVGEAAARARVETALAQLAAAEVEAAAAAQAEKDAVDASALRQAQARREEAQERLKQSRRELALCEDDATALAQSRSEEESRQRQAQARREEAQKRQQQSALGPARSEVGAPPPPTCGEPPIRRTRSLQPMPLGINRLGSRRRVAVGINDAPSSCGTNPSGRPGLPKKAVRTHAQSQAHKWLFDALTTADDHDGESRHAQHPQTPRA